jgi:Zn-dependent peptidase ImmA (M78 family)
MPQQDPMARRARELRAAIGLADGPVPEILSTLERLGLSVYVLPLGSDGPDGAYLPRAQFKTVLLNADKYLARLRFTAAHELGHHVFNDGAQMDKDIHQFRSLEEQRANGFAAAFLMPDTGILARLGVGAITPRDVVRIALEFGVSYTSLVHRLQKLQRVTPQQKAALLRDRAAVLTPEFRLRHLSVKQQLPSDYVDRALRAYDDWKISLDRLSELLRIPDDEREGLVGDLREQHLLREEDDPRTNGPRQLPPAPRETAPHSA